MRYADSVGRNWNALFTYAWRYRDYVIDSLNQDKPYDQFITEQLAGLIADLKQRDLLKDTLVVWGGEFGRQANPDNNGGRGHNNKGFTMWMAGGGVKGGFRYGSTDELGRQAVAGKMGTHDLHATMLHLLGLDHELLTYHYSGRDFRLTDVGGEVAHQILA